MHALLDDMRKKAATAGSENPVMTDNGQMWELMLGRRDSSKLKVSQKNDYKPVSGLVIPHALETSALGVSPKARNPVAERRVEVTAR